MLMRCLLLPPIATAACSLSASINLLRASKNHSLLFSIKPSPLLAFFSLARQVNDTLLMFPSLLALQVLRAPLDILFISSNAMSTLSLCSASSCLAIHMIWCSATSSLPQMSSSRLRQATLDFFHAVLSKKMKFRHTVSFSVVGKCERLSSSYISRVFFETHLLCHRTCHFPGQVCFFLCGPSSTLRHESARLIQLNRPELLSANRHPSSSHINSSQHPVMPDTLLKLTDLGGHSSQFIKQHGYPNPSWCSIPHTSCNGPKILPCVRQSLCATVMRGSKCPPKNLPCQRLHIADLLNVVSNRAEPKTHCWHLTLHDLHVTPLTLEWFCIDRLLLMFTDLFCLSHENSDKHCYCQKLREEAPCSIKQLHNGGGQCASEVNWRCQVTFLSHRIRSMAGLLHGISVTSASNCCLLIIQPSLCKSAEHQPPTPPTLPTSPLRSCGLFVTFHFTFSSKHRSLALSVSLNFYSKPVRSPIFWMPNCLRRFLQGSSSSSSSRTVSRASRWLTNKDQKVRDGFSTKMEVLCTNFFVPKKKSWPAVLSPGVVASPGFPGRSSPPGFLFFFLFLVVLLRIRGFCDLIREFSTATACGSCLCCLLFVL